MSGEDWRPILAELRRRKDLGRSMGGPERVAKQHAEGKLDARQRLARLFDPGTLVELGTLAGDHVDGPSGDAPGADALVGGIGCIDGRPAVAAAEDFTVLAGSIGNATSDKRYRLAALALQERVPLVFLLEGAGNRLTNPPAGRRPHDLQALVELSGRVPMVALVLGPSAGHSALTVPMCDFTVMTPEASLFVAGPPLVKRATGQEVAKSELGGPDVHITQSGVVHNLAADDTAAIALARRYLAYFPPNAWTAPPTVEGGDTGPRLLDDILDIVPVDVRAPYPMRAVLERLVDADTLFEVQPGYGSAVLTVLARLGGRSVAIIANDPSVKAGAIDGTAARKTAHFLDVVGAFHLPVVFLADNPGVMTGPQAEAAGAVREAVRMYVAEAQLQVPKLHVTLRKAFGFGSTAMAMNPFDRQTISLAFPGATLGALPVDGGAEPAKLDDEARARIAAEQASGAYRAAATMSYDDVIDPRELRNALLQGLALSANRAQGPFEPVARIGITP